MIAVDTSALMAILLDESEAEACMDVLEGEDDVVMSAGTLAETLIVAGRRDLEVRMKRLIEGLGIEIAPLTEDAAISVSRAYHAYGKGRHRAGLNLGDCFAYETATTRNCPLLFVGEDFGHTDVASAIPQKHTGVMSGDLFGREEAPRQIERLFFGLLLPEEAASNAGDVLEESRDTEGLRGRPIRQDRLHVTLIHVGDYQGMPPGSVVENLKQAAGAMTAKAFDIAFDRVSSFSGAPGRHPHVLLGDRGVEALKTFRGELLKAVIRQGVKPLSRQDFNPHVTLSYADRRLPERPVRPIAWRPGEFVLIHSEVGRSIYHVLGRWPLR